MTDLLARLTTEERLVLVLGEADARRLGAWGAIPDVLAGAPLDGLGPEALHAAAIALARTDAWARSVEAWDRLLRSGASYLEALARVASVELPDLEAVVLDAALAPITAATQGERAREAHMALRQIARQDGPCAARAAAAIAEASRAACARWDLRVSELTADLPVPVVAGAFAEVARDEDRLGGDPTLRRRVVAAFEPIAWRSYKARAWDDLRTLLRGVVPVVHALEREMLEAPRDLAFRASLAQALVFESEMAETLEAQLVLSQRAMAILPTCRNARVVRAAQLVARAEQRKRAREQGWREDAQRALELDPRHPRARALAES